MPAIEYFPKEILLQIMSHLGLQDTLNIKASTKLFEQLASNPMLWKQLMAKHFPHAFELLVKQKNVDWYENFKAIYQEEYVNLSAQAKKWFTLAKEDNLDGLQKETITFADLMEKDARNISLLTWIVRSTKNQATLDYFYKKISDYYSTAFKKVSRDEDEKDPTLLYWASYLNQSHDVIEDLIRKGADVNAVTKENNETPLWIACHNGNVQIVNTLLNAGADFNIARNIPVPQVIIDYLTNGGTAETMDDSIRAEFEPFSYQYEQTPLAIASAEGRVEVVERLLKTDVNVNSANRFKITPVMQAARNGHVKIISLLAKMGADLTFKNGLGKTALIVALDNGHPEVVKELVNNGVDLNIVDQSEKTLLMRAAQQGNVNHINALIDGGADLNKKNSKGKTALSIAIENNQADFVTALIKKGANLNIVDQAGKTPLMRAVEMGNVNIINMLVDGGADLNIRNSVGETAVMIAAKNRMFDVVTKLVKKDANLNLKGKQSGETLLMKAAETDDVDLINALANGGANLNAVDESRNNVTALMVAVVKNKLKAVIALVERGADLNITSKNGKIALDFAKNNKPIKNYLNTVNSKGTILEKVSEGLSNLFLSAKKVELYGVEVAQDDLSEEISKITLGRRIN